MAKILSGAPVRESLVGRLKNRILKLGFKPTLAIVQVGDRPDSNLYIKNKIKFGGEIGVNVTLEKLIPDGDIKKDSQVLISVLKKLSERPDINGIILQLPLPQGFDTDNILKNIAEDKDADGLVSTFMVPATARGVIALLEYYDVDIEGKSVAVIGRSKLAGGPIAKELEKRGAHITVCHRGTQDMAKICRESQLLVTAAGVAGLVKRDFVNKDQVVVDVGINKVEGKIVGDADFAEIEPLVNAITPVPGGIGLLTVACLFENLIDLAEKQA